MKYNIIVNYYLKFERKDKLFRTEKANLREALIIMVIKFKLFIWYVTGIVKHQV